MTAGFVYLMLLALGGFVRRVKVFFWLLVICLLPSVSPNVCAQQRMETARDVNERIQALSSAQRGPAGDYVIGGGDLLKIDVFDVPDLSREVRVAESGYISLPLIPVKIRAAGLSPFQLEEKLVELLQVHGLVSKPEVTVFVQEQRSQPITVIGAVRAPKVLQAVRTMTLLEVLSEAGGIADDAGHLVMVTRPAGPAPQAPGTDSNPEKTAPPAGQTFSIRMKDLLESGESQFNIRILGGDIVSVPRAGIIYIAGAVERPGGFVMQSDAEEMTALKLVALAQGLKGSAKPGQAVILRKNRETGQNQEIEIHLGKIMSRKAGDVPLLPNDILFVPDSTGKKVLRRMGEVTLGITSGLVIIRAGR
jgi:polysaccharide export outer membrane protein